MDSSNLSLIQGGFKCWKIVRSEEMRVRGYVRRVNLLEIQLLHHSLNKSNGLVWKRCSQIGEVCFGSQIQFWYFYEDLYQEPWNQFADCQLQYCHESHHTQRFQTNHCHGQALRSYLQQGLYGGSQRHQSLEPSRDRFPIESGGSDCCFRGTWLSRSGQKALDAAKILEWKFTTLKLIFIIIE